MKVSLNIHDSTGLTLLGLAYKQNVTKGEILRRALSVYNYILEAKVICPELEVLLNRNGKLTELVVPE